VTQRHARALRGTVAAAVATVIAATAHTLAGGGAPSPALVAAVGILAAPAAVALAGRRLSPWRVGMIVLASQALFHLAFAITAGADPTAPHAHHTMVLAGGVTPVALPDAPMLVAHALAAIATAAGLYGGERMLRALGRGIHAILSRARVSAPLPVVPRLVASTRVRESRPARIALSGLSRRGPPVFVAAAR
jgi:hypothetical protein